MLRTYRIEYLTNDSRLRSTRYTADGPAAARALFVAHYGLPADSVRSIDCDGGPRVDTFESAVALGNLFPAVTLKAAAAEARGLGYMIRRESDWGQVCRGWEVYPIGQSDSAHWCDSPAEARFYALAMAADSEAGRVALGRVVSVRGMARVIANAAADSAFGWEASTLPRDVIGVDVALVDGIPVVTFRAVGLEYVATLWEGATLERAGRMAAAAEALAQELAAYAGAAMQAGAETGDTGPDWEAGPDQASYAQLPDVDGRAQRYAFGPCRGAALAQLARDAEAQSPRRSLSAAATPAILAEPQRGRSGAALGRSGGQPKASGAFPLWAVLADRTAAAIDESLALGLFDDCNGWEELPAGLESFQ